MAYFLSGMLTLLLFLNGFQVFLKGNWDTANVFAAYLGIPIFLAFYFGHKLTAGRQDPWLLNPSTVDLHSGLDEVIAREEPLKEQGRWRRFKTAMWG